MNSVHVDPNSVHVPTWVRDLESFRRWMHSVESPEKVPIFDWLRARSPDGAIRWWFAFDEAVHNLVDHPHGYGFAPETESVRYDLRQFLFKTRRGRRYRGVFVVVGDEVRVLRIRGPGQAPLEPDELE